MRVFLHCLSSLFSSVASSDLDEVVPASHLASSTSSRPPSPTPLQHNQHPPHTHHHDQDKDINAQSLEPSVLHTRQGGAAWSLELPGWNKQHLKDLTSSGKDSKRGSLSSGVGSASASRKSSFTFGADPKNFRFGSHQSQLHPSTGPSFLTQPHRGGHETLQSIWAATHEDLGSNAHSGRMSTLEDKSLLTSGGEHSATGGSGEPSQKRLSLSSSTGKYPFLRAHTTENRLGVTSYSKPIRGASGNINKKRASMPPLRNRRPSLQAALATAALGSTGTTLSGGGNSRTTSRRSSMIHHVPSQPVRAASVRHRSQSLPSDSLFLAYASCALPAVMTSSLANMPIPSQPAIPVEVARRYSILAHPSDLTEQHAAAASEAQEVAATETTEHVMYADPNQIDGIDTLSSLDTSHLQDIATSDEIEEGDEENVRSDDDEEAHTSGHTSEDDDNVRALLTSHLVESGLPSLSISKSMLPSTYSTPMGSPVDSEHHVPVDVFPPSLLDTSSELVLPSTPHSSPNDAPSTGLSPFGSPTSYPVFHTPTEGSPVTTGSHTTVDVPPPTASSSSSSSAAPHRSRNSLIHMTVRNGRPVLLPTRDQQQSSSRSTTPDYTPMTSPTNLSHQVFKQTLMTRRMSDVVARDITRKLKILKKHMKEDDGEAENGEDVENKGIKQQEKV